MTALPSLISSKPTKCDILIIGSGILGLILAAHMSRTTNRQIVLAYEPAGDQLRADTLRSQSWLQSGLLYTGSFTDSYMGDMLKEGRSMLSAFGVEKNTERGIFAFRSGEELSKFRDAAAHTASDKLSIVEQLTGDEAKSRLGELYTRQRTYFEVPDTSFRPSDLMVSALQVAIDNGVMFVESKVSLAASENSKYRYTTVLANGQTLEASSTVLCAGSGNPTLLAQLGLDNTLCVYRSILLRTRQEMGFLAPVFADRSNGLTVVQVSRHGAELTSRLVIGDWHRVRLKNDETERHVLKEFELERLKSLLPKPARQFLEGSTAIAGHKTEHATASERRSVAPWVETYPEFPGLVAAVPGKATLAFLTAKRIERLLASDMTPDKSNVRPRLPISITPNCSLTPHYEHPFDKLHEIDPRRA